MPDLRRHTARLLRRLAAWLDRGADRATMISLIDQHDASLWTAALRGFRTIWRRDARELAAAARRALDDLYTAGVASGDVADRVERDIEAALIEAAEKLCGEYVEETL